MGIFEILSIVPSLLFVLLGLTVPFFVYIVARWREDKGGPPDPHLGFATIYGLVAYLGFTVVLGALSVFFGQIFSGAKVQVALPGALLVSGGMVFAAGLVAVLNKTAIAPSRASRLYLGLAVMSSSVLSAALFIAVAVMLAMETRGRDLAMPLALLLVNLPVAIVGGRLIGTPRKVTRTVLD